MIKMSMFVYSIFYIHTEMTTVVTMIALASPKVINVAARKTINLGMSSFLILETLYLLTILICYPAVRKYIFVPQDLKCILCVYSSRIFKNILTCF